MVAQSCHFGVKVPEQKKKRDKRNPVYQHLIFSKVFITPLSWGIAPVTKDKVLDLAKLKAFADNKIDRTQKLIFVLAWIENIVRKVEMLVIMHLFLFPQCFQKASFFGH